MTASARLKQARINAGYTSAAKAAAALGMTSSTYAAHENGQNSFTIEQAETYAYAFRVSASWICFGEQTKAEPSVIALVRLLERKGVITESEGREVLELASSSAESSGL